MLILATMNGHTDIVKLLLDHGEEVDSSDLVYVLNYCIIQGVTCLLVLCVSSSIDIREKGRYLTQSCDKNPYTHRTIQNAT